MTQTAIDDLSKEELTVLITLAESADFAPWDCEAYLTFADISARTGLPVPAVRKACRRLRELGLAECACGLINPDNWRTAGSGYCATEEGCEKAARAMGKYEELYGFYEELNRLGASDDGND